ncbi:MAG TPA: hypothetical protein VM370_12760 [Candidatus Thermoplasmatota archaeon]|nr:hypothetical protein [Candidatus Thermoplasmatota archaeon]
MKNVPLVFAIILVAAALAGCTGTKTTPTPTTVTGASPTPTPTPTPTVVPSVTPPTSVPTVTPPPVPGVTTGITSVNVLSAPLQATGADAQVCFRVGGRGNAQHVAVHYDNVSHPNSTAFTDYKGGAAYADEGSKTLTGQIPLPGAWCVKVPTAGGPVYFRAHALMGTQSILSEEKVIVPAGQPVDLDGFFPQLSAHESTVQLCWRAAGEGVAIHTAIHFDFTSHPNATSFTDYKAGAYYAENESKTLSANLTLPGRWCVNQTLGANDGAVYYMRAHAAIRAANGTVTHVLGPERSLSVTPAVGVTNGLPAKAAANSNVLVCWRAEGEGKAPHTAIHWDTESHASEANAAFTAYNGGAPSYPDNQTAAAAAGYELPGPFCSNVKMPASGTLYFVAHVLNPAIGRNEISHEYAIPVG